ALAADLAEVGAGAGAVLEDARLADPKVHDAATVDEVILDVLDEAGVRLRPGVSVGALDDLVRVGRVDVVVPLGRAGDVVGPGEAGIEPLRRVRGGHLHGHHVLQLVLERLGVLGGGEVVLLLAPVAPGADEAADDLLRGALGAGDRGAVLVADDVALLVVLGDAGLAEVLGDHDVGRDLRPGSRDLRI